MEYTEDRIEVRTYFRDGGKLLGTEVCSSELEARIFAKHQLTLFPRVEIVYVHGVMHEWGYEIKQEQRIAIYD